MIAQLVKKAKGNICGNCRMLQKELQPQCWFCGYTFSNYEDFLLENYLERKDYND